MNEKVLFIYLELKWKRKLQLKRPCFDSKKKFGGIVKIGIWKRIINHSIRSAIKSEC